MVVEEKEVAVSETPAEPLPVQLDPKKEWVEVYLGMLENGLGVELEIHQDGKNYWGRWIGHDPGPDAFVNDYFEGEVEPPIGLIKIPGWYKEGDFEYWGAYREECECFDTQTRVPASKASFSALGRVAVDSLEEIPWSEGVVHISERDRFILFGARLRDPFEDFGIRISEKVDSMRNEVDRVLEAGKSHPAWKARQAYMYSFSKYVKKHLISIGSMQYNVLGKYGNCHHIEGFNLDKRQWIQFSIADLLRDEARTWEFLSSFCRNSDLLAGLYDDEVFPGITSRLDSITQPHPWYFRNFLLVEDGIEVIFNPEIITENSFDFHCGGRVFVPMDELESYLNPKGPLGSGKYQHRPIQPPFYVEGPNPSFGVGNYPDKAVYLGTLQQDGSMPEKVSLKVKFNANMLSGTLKFGSFPEAEVNGVIEPLPGGGNGMILADFMGGEFVRGDSMLGEMLDIRYDDNGNFYTEEGFRLVLKKDGKKWKAVYLEPFVFGE